MADCPVVETSLGKAKGRVVSKVEGGKDVFLYTNLPFAKPPIGELRFKPPTSPEPWDGILDASEHSPSPHHDSTLMIKLRTMLPLLDDRIPKSHSEDCLYLSVYTTNPSEDQNRPVLVWIYGGGFAIGGEAYFDLSALVSLHNVVVVVPNYRLNVFGFLSLGQNTDYPGNVGLLDQTMAMKWTRDHIRAFGGNPDNITILGESSGAMAVNCHVLSPMSKGLFHRAVSHSGSVFMGFPGKSGPAPLQLLAEELKLNEKDPETLIKILQTLPAEDIQKVLGRLVERMAYFPAVTDGKFIPKDFSELRKEPVASNVPYIIGVNNSECKGAMAWDLKDLSDGISEDVCMNALKGFMAQMICTGLPDSAFDRIKDYYMARMADEDELKWSKLYGEAMGDIFFVTPAIKTAQHHDGTEIEKFVHLESADYTPDVHIESKGVTYVYEMTQQPKYSHDPAYGPESARKPSFCECDHTDDMTFTMGIPLTDKKLSIEAKFTDDEKELSKEWMKYIVNFAENGDPNVGLPVKVRWLQYNSENQIYLSVQQPCSGGKKYKEKTFKFWEEVMQLQQNHPIAST